MVHITGILLVLYDAYVTQEGSIYIIIMATSKKEECAALSYAFVTSYLKVRVVC